MDKCVIKGHTTDQIAQAFASQCTMLIGDSYVGRDGKSTLQNISVANFGENPIPEDIFGKDHEYTTWKELIQAQLQRSRDRRLESVAQGSPEPQNYLNLNYRNKDNNQCMAQILSCFKVSDSGRVNKFLVVRVEESIAISPTGFSGGFGNDSLMQASRNTEEQEKATAGGKIEAPLPSKPPGT